MQKNPNPSNSPNPILRLLRALLFPDPEDRI